jgi:predicted enzyme involved in methoxymalonyl-ACP biosynthesis
MNKISADDVNAIKHINYVTNKSHDLVTDLYEDLMERDHEEAKVKAQNICKIMVYLIHSLSDEV